MLKVMPGGKTDDRERRQQKKIGVKTE